MPNRLFICVVVEILVQIIPTLRQIVEELPQRLSAALMIVHGSIELRSVTRRQDDQSAQTVVFAQTQKSRTQFLTGK